MYSQYMCILIPICDTYLVLYSIGLLSIGVAGVDVSSVYVHSADMCNLFGVTLFHRCVVMNGICHYAIYESYLFSIGGGVDVSSVYVHSAICDSYLV